MDTNNVSTIGDPHGSPVVAVTITDKLNDKVIALIVNLTGSNTVFTAFDLTKQLRVENPTMNVPHKNGVREMVLAEFENTFCDDYDRECIELTVGRAFVYFPEDMSAYDHPLAVPLVAPIASAAPTTTSDPDSDLTAHNRLNIPKDDLKKLGLVAGKMVRIDIDATEGVLSLTEATSTPYETLTVNTDGRLRLNDTTLRKAFGRLPDKYDITRSVDNMTIFVKPQ